MPLSEEEEKDDVEIELDEARSELDNRRRDAIDIAAFINAIRYECDLGQFMYNTRKGNSMFARLPLDMQIMCRNPLVTWGPDSKMPPC